MSQNATTPTTQKPMFTVENGRVCLVKEFNGLLTEFEAVEKLPAYRPDVKIKESQRLASKSIALTGELMMRFEALESLILKPDENKTETVNKNASDTVH